MPGVFFEQVCRRHEVTRVGTQFVLLIQEVLPTFLDGVACLFMGSSVGGLMLSIAVVDDSAGLTQKKL